MEVFLYNIKEIQIRPRTDTHDLNVKLNHARRFLLEGDRSLTIARLALVQSVVTVIAGGLRTIGVEPAEELRS